MSYDYDVVVIGGGPVGVTTLGLLGTRGLRAVGIEKLHEPWKLARAVHFDGETLRSLQTLGVADEVMSHCRPMVDFRFTNEQDEIVVAATLGQFGPQAWHDDLIFHQPDIEPILRATTERTAGVELRCGTRLVDFSQSAQGVTVRVENADGDMETITARWLVAADGATSTVRKQLGLGTECLGSDDPWVVIDGHLRGKEGLDGDMVFIGRHSRPGLWLRLPGDRVRLECKLLDGDDHDEIVTPEAIERLSRGVLDREHFEADRVAIYTFRARLAERFRVGNVFLVGDAAHQAPPLFGQGLCAGMRDAANLSWKLGMVARSLTAEDLLDTYESERREHAKYWVSRAAAMAGMVQTLDPQVAAGRDAHLRAHPDESAQPPAPPLGPGLHDGETDERAGTLSIQPMSSDGTRLDDLVGYRFLLATTDEALTAVSPEMAAALDASSEIQVITDPAWTTELLAGSSALVVRPDRYVLGAAATPADLEPLLARVPSLTNHRAPAPA